MSQRLRGDLIEWKTSNDHCRSTFSNDFFSETAGPISSLLYIHSPGKGRTKVCSNGPGHMIKLAAIPIYNKTLEKSSLPTCHLWEKAYRYVLLTKLSFGNKECTTELKTFVCTSFSRPDWLASAS